MNIIKDIWVCFVAFVFMFIVATAALDAWTYEAYGDCEHCVLLDGYFELRDG